MKNIKVKSVHQNLYDAVCSSGMDLSYNLEAVASKIKSIMTPSRDGWKSGEAYVMEDNSVCFWYQCDILLINKFDPFCSCMDDSHFHPVERTEDGFKVHDEIRLQSSSRGLMREMSVLEGMIFSKDL